MDIKLLLSTFLEGLLSFLSPCVLPLLPLYMAYLSNDEGDNKSQFKTFIRTLFFVLGIFTVFLLLAISASMINKFIQDYKDYISIVGAVIIFIFGLHELGIININFLNKEAKLNIDLKIKKITLFKAYTFGFIFAFGWTPCLGPMLTSAVLLASTRDFGYLYIVAYGLGLTIPFIITGSFTTFILNLLNRFKKIMNYILKIAGVVLIIFSIYTIYNSVISLKEIKHQNEINERIENRDNNYAYVPNVEILDTNGNKINLNDYYGKYIYLNISATWCGYCKDEYPELDEFCNEHDDVACFIVMNKELNGGTNDDIIEYQKENNINTPILMDDNYDIIQWGYSGVPFLWVIAPDSSIVGYNPGAITKDIFEMIHEWAKEAYEAR